MRDVFKLLPDTIAPYLSQNNRLDCIDFIDSNMKAEVHNSLGGKSELLALTDKYALVKLSDALLVEMRLLDTTQEVDGSRQIVCVVQTFGTDVRESVVSFYTPEWRRLSTDDYLLCPDDMFTAQLNQSEPSMSLTPVSYFERPAMEEQEEIPVLSKSLNWKNDSFK